MDHFWQLHDGFVPNYINLQVLQKSKKGVIGEDLNTLMQTETVCCHAMNWFPYSTPKKAQICLE